MATDIPAQAFTLCRCSNGVIVYIDGYCFPREGSLESVTKLYKDEDVWFLEFVDVTTAMLILLVKSPFIQEALECLRTREPGHRYTYSQLLAKEIAQKIVVLQAIKGRDNSDLRTDISSVSRELKFMSDTGMIYRDE